MRVNHIKQKLLQGERVFGTMIKEARNVNIAEILEIAGFDYFVIDMEHGYYDMADIEPILHFARRTNITAVVRIPGLDYTWVAKALDMGAEGIWAPRLETAAEAKALVDYGKYPPEGKRGAAVPVFRLLERQAYRQATDYYRAVNEETLLIVQLESGTAVRNAAAITALPGIDVAVLGMQNLALDLGYPGRENHPAMRDAVQEVVDACRKNGKASGNHTKDIEDLRYWIGQGMQLITWSYETNLMIDRGRELLKVLKA